MPGGRIHRASICRNRPPSHDASHPYDEKSILFRQYESIKARIPQFLEPELLQWSWFLSGSLYFHECCFTILEKHKVRESTFIAKSYLYHDITSIFISLDDVALDDAFQCVGLLSLKHIVCINASELDSSALF